MEKKFCDKVNGREIYLYTIKSDNVGADICDFGARINAIRVGGVDIALGFNSTKDYVDSDCYAGATVGRVANRIANGRFKLNGTIYNLFKREGGYHLHGGKIGFDKKLFNVKNCTDSSVVFEYESADGEEGYPGSLKMTVTYKVECNSLCIEFKAICDKDTLWNPTNHTYFNLDGEGSDNCLDNYIQINADYYTSTDENLVCNGGVASVGGTPLDMRKNKRIGESIESDFLAVTKGYDHNYILKGEHAAHVESLKTGIKMDLITDMPCIQLYSGGQLCGCNGKSTKYNKWAGFCLEPQFCPNAINLDGFEKPILKKEEVKRHYIKLKF